MDTSKQIPIDPTIAPAPASPAPVQGVPAPAGQEMSQEEMMTNLQALMGKINNKYKEFNDQKVSSKSKLEQQRNLAIKGVSDLFKSAGVDANNVKDVKDFLDKLKVSNPDLYIQVSKALEDILGGNTLSQGTNMLPPEGNVVPPTGITTPENMNMQNENISQKI